VEVGRGGRGERVILVVVQVMGQDPNIAPFLQGCAEIKGGNFIHEKRSGRKVKVGACDFLKLQERQYFVEWRGEEYSSV